MIQQMVSAQLPRDYIEYHLYLSNEEPLKAFYQTRTGALAEGIRQVTGGALDVSGSRISSG